jgi:predicted DNA-binding transcriptional regulator AlpA
MAETKLKRRTARLKTFFRTWSGEQSELRALAIDDVAQQLSVSKDWVYRSGKKLPFSKKLGPNGAVLTG